MARFSRRGRREHEPFDVFCPGYCPGSVQDRNPGFYQSVQDVQDITHLLRVGKKEGEIETYV
jgi:hypothetical protein